MISFIEDLQTDHFNEWSRYDLQVYFKKELEVKVRELNRYIQKNQKNITSRNNLIQKKKQEIYRIKSILKYV